MESSGFVLNHHFGCKYQVVDEASCIALGTNAPNDDLERCACLSLAKSFRLGGEVRYQSVSCF